MCVGTRSRPPPPPIPPPPEEVGALFNAYHARRARARGGESCGMGRHIAASLLSGLQGGEQIALPACVATQGVATAPSPGTDTLRSRSLCRAALRRSPSSRQTRSPPRSNGVPLTAWPRFVCPLREPALFAASPHIPRAR